MDLLGLKLVIADQFFDSACGDSLEIGQEFWQREIAIAVEVHAGKDLSGLRVRHLETHLLEGTEKLVDGDFV